MSDGYISTKNLSVEEAHTGAARGEALARKKEIEKLIAIEAALLVEKRKKEKKSTKRKERKKKEL